MNRYNITISLKEKNINKKMAFLSDIKKIEDENKITIKKTTCKIDEMKINLSSTDIYSARFDYIKEVRDLSSKYGKIDTKIEEENSLYRLIDSTNYSFATGSMMEKEYHFKFC